MSQERTIWGAILAAALLLLLWWLLKKKAAATNEEEVVTPPDETTTPATDPETIRSHLVPKVDTRFPKRWDYHKAVYQALKNRGIPDNAARAMTAHASKAQRGWKSPNPGKLWNFNCFGIIANPHWQVRNEFFARIDPPQWIEAHGYYNGNHVSRSYASVQESVNDYLQLLRSERYQVVFAYAITMTLNEHDFKDWAALLKECGYLSAAAQPDVFGASLWNIYHNIVRPDLE
jgi:hypothetical protein